VPPPPPQISAPVGLFLTFFLIPHHLCGILPFLKYIFPEVPLASLTGSAVPCRPGWKQLCPAWAAPASPHREAPGPRAAGFRGSAPASGTFLRGSAVDGCGCTSGSSHRPAGWVRGEVCSAVWSSEAGTAIESVSGSVSLFFPHEETSFPVSLHDLVLRWPCSPDRAPTGSRGQIVFPVASMT